MLGEMATAIQRASAASRGGSSADEMAIEDRKCAFCMKDHNNGIEVLGPTLDKSINNRAYSSLHCRLFAATTVQYNSNSWIWSTSIRPSIHSQQDEKE